MEYKGLEIARFFILDQDNQDDPQEMLKDPDFYQAPDDPHFFMSASQMRDMMNIVENISCRIGGYHQRIVWFVELEQLKGQLVEVMNYNKLED
jgi:hypothetical protein